jgi:hypothetical protein
MPAGLGGSRLFCQSLGILARRYAFGHQLPVVDRRWILPLYLYTSWLLKLSGYRHVQDEPKKTVLLRFLVKIFFSGNGSSGVKTFREFEIFDVKKRFPDSEKACVLK